MHIDEAKKKIEFAILVGKNFLNINFTISYCFRKQVFFEKNIVTALYDDKTKTIIFNEDWVAIIQNTIDIINVTFHEMRHIYQQVQMSNYVTKKEIIEPEERIKQWINEYSDYIRFDGKYHEKYLNNILLIDFEIDAIAYSNYALEKIFNLQSFVPRKIVDIVRERKNDIDSLTPIVVEKRK